MDASPGAAVRAAVAQAIGGGCGQEGHWRPGPLSSFNATWRVELGGAAYFVKTGSLDREAMFAGEAAGLRALDRARAVRVPQVVAAGRSIDQAFLVLEWLDVGRGGRDGALGRALAALHRTRGERFGFDADNTVGPTPQDNRWSGDWPSFFRDRRLAPQLAMLAAKCRAPGVLRAGERLLSHVPAVLGGHCPAPSLLHGDLWSGNAARLESGQPVLFDPAAYFGDREADLAMTELFGGFAPDFYAAYREAWPLPPGYAVRRDLYNLYHVLNHLNLFGGAYAAQAASLIERLLAEVR